ncbi:hypothetical protein [Streptacidiphilus sp. P02-A3a]|uniref:hypothetical protein n=1 Tax=Streptacidiphilus sp. P02-A3a TaxID=2704468 RepID=UPI0015F8E78C|nr:hypothetical protein [Streptacidiphilus sp. P02-A3a]QMU68291.1 hypothetical protein GXP74_08685 [Streptacidiphilus sp. P02-A3a]
MNGAEFDSFRRMASTFTPTTVTRFLAAQGWTAESRTSGVKEIWSRRAASGSAERARVMIPFAIDYVDFERRFSEALISISQVHGYDAEDLSRRISSTMTDVLSVRLVRTPAGDTVPLAEGEKVIHEFNNLLKNFAIATATHRVRRTGGRMPRQAADFMRHHARLGHTRSGSFVITFAALLDESERSPSPTHQDVDRRHERDESAPFARKVMAALAQAIETAGELRSGSPEIGWARTTEELRRAALVVEMLDRFRSFDELEEIDLSFTWASALPEPTAGLSVCSFRFDDLPEIPAEPGRIQAAAERAFDDDYALRRVAGVSPPDALDVRRTATSEEIVSGIVHSLERADGGGTVTIRVDDGRSPFDVRLTLRAADYLMAVRAHLADVPVSASGELTRIGPTARLGNAVLDTAKIEAALRALP